MVQIFTSSTQRGTSKPNTIPDYFRVSNQNCSRVDAFISHRSLPFTCWRDQLTPSHIYTPLHQSEVTGYSAVSAVQHTPLSPLSTALPQVLCSWPLSKLLCPLWLGFQALHLNEDKNKNKIYKIKKKKKSWYKGKGGILILQVLSSKLKTCQRSSAEIEKKDDFFNTCWQVLISFPPSCNINSARGTPINSLDSTSKQMSW